MNILAINPPQLAPDYFMREPEVKRICPVSRVTRWRWERDGKFPKRRQIGPNCVGWLASEVFAWRDAVQPPTVA